MESVKQGSQKLPPPESQTTTSSSFSKTRLSNRNSVTPKGILNRNNKSAEPRVNGEATPLLEIRPIITGNSVDDQRDKLKGNDGCLHSRVKQCVRFVKYREKLDKQDDERPVKNEPGRYRPFSKTEVQEHIFHPGNSTPDLKLQKSVDTYRKYVENIAMQTRISTPKHSFRASSSNPSQYSTMTPSGVDTDSLIVQSVMDSNLPDTSGLPRHHTTLVGQTGSSALNSAIYTKDVSGMNDALNIKRLSAKKSINRVVAGTRDVKDGNYEEFQTPQMDNDEDDGNANSIPNTPTTDAIVVPRMAAKSECASEYSIPTGV